jgi:hypothetical protein
VLERLPETQDLIERLRKKYDLGPERVFSELDRGLKESMPEGKHGDYLDRAMKVNGLGQDKGGGPGEGLAVIGALVSALDSARAQHALERTAIPAEKVVAQPPQQENSPP